MASKRPSRKPARSEKRRKNYPVFARVEPALGQALEAFLERTRPRTTEGAVVTTALEEFLTRAGLWPPPDQQKPPS